MAKRFIGGEIVSNVAPAGSVAAFAGANAPSGWRICDGQTLSIELFPELYAAIGDTWNLAFNPVAGADYTAGELPAGHFRLPDFRGSFLRGVGKPHTVTANADACFLGKNQAQKTAKNGLNPTMSASGAHWHQKIKSILNYHQGSTAGEYHPSVYGNTYHGTSASPLVSSDGSAHTHAISLASDSETRPLNQGVNYIIKY